MRPWWTLLLVLTWTLPAGADDWRSGGFRRQPQPEVYVPFVPEADQRLHYFGRPDEHVVPGAVGINKAPYRCDIDRKGFKDKRAFVAHLRSVHKVPLDEIPDRIVVEDGLVRFLAP